MENNTRPTLTPEQSAELEKALAKIRNSSEKALEKKLQKKEDEFYKFIELRKQSAAILLYSKNLIANNEDFLNKFPEDKRGSATRLLMKQPDLQKQAVWNIYDPRGELLRMVQGTYEQACLFAVTLPEFNPWSDCSTFIEEVSENKGFLKLS